MRSFVIASVACLAATAASFAFGIEQPQKGVGSEHERITRAAITDMDPATLDALAGKGENTGAVGAPDAYESSRNDIVAHCDGGDYLAPAADAEPYAQTIEAAEAALTNCRLRIFAELNAAVEEAGKLATAQGEDLSPACEFNRPSGTKCKVLNHLGRAFHTAQDFYARTNWVDTPAAGAVSAENPPGLGKIGRAKWLDPRLNDPFPTGLISGCPGELEVLGVTIGCEYGDWSPVTGLRRVMRADLSKDFGPIGRGKGGLGMTPRGAINRNFARAVEAAIEDTVDKWAYFKEQVGKTFGADAPKIICVLQSDTGDTAACLKTASRGQVCTRRTTGDAASVEPPTAEERQEAATLWPTLRSACRLEELDLTRNATISGGKAADGLAIGQANAEEVLAFWNACPVQARQHLDAVAGEHKATILADKEPADGKPKAKLRELLAAAYADCILDARLRQLGK